MPVAITSVTISELGEAIVYFDATVDIPTMSRGAPWQIDLVTPLAVESCIYDAEVLGGFASAKVWFSPPLSPTCDYTISVLVTDSLGATNTATVNVTAPNVTKPLSDEWYHGVLQAWSRTVSQTIQELSGVPMTLLTRDILPGDDKVFVESTLGFPADGGYFFVGRRRHRYGSTSLPHYPPPDPAKSPACFMDVVADEATTRTVHRKQAVVLDVLAHEAPGGYPYLTAWGVPLVDPNGVF